jgi:hypothetical protein
MIDHQRYAGKGDIGTPQYQITETRQKAEVKVAIQTEASLMRGEGKVEAVNHEAVRLTETTSFSEARA